MLTQESTNKWDFCLHAVTQSKKRPESLSVVPLTPIVRSDFTAGDAKENSTAPLTTPLKRNSISSRKVSSKKSKKN